MKTDTFSLVREAPVVSCRGRVGPQNAASRPQLPASVTDHPGAQRDRSHF